MAKRAWARIITSKLAEFMKIAFVASKCLPFHGHSLEERPLGGTETAIIRLAEELSALGHEVKVFTSFENPPASRPPYFPISALPQETELDALVSMRDLYPLFLGVPARKRFYWTEDSFDQVNTFGLGDPRVIGVIDAFFAVSAWHAATLCAHSGFPLEKAWVIRNGVHLPYFAGQETRERKRLIYSSAPYRGLALVPDLYSQLRKRHPEMTLHVFSGFDVYQGESGCQERTLKQFQAVKRRLAELPGCVLHGNVRQKELAREFMKSAILFYPNTFAETSCITAIEAQAAGCAVVTSDDGALKETVGEAGVLIKGRPDSAEYQKEFLAACDKILADDAYFETLSQAGQKRAQEIFSWPLIARRFEDYLKKVHGL